MLQTVVNDDLAQTTVLAGSMFYSSGLFAFELILCLGFVLFALTLLLFVVMSWALSFVCHKN